jgi:hypothetical protein
MNCMLITPIGDDRHGRPQSHSPAQAACARRPRCCERAIVLSQGRACQQLIAPKSPVAMNGGTLAPAHTSWAIWAGGGPWSVALRHHFAAARNERIGAARRDQALSPSARHRRRDRDPEKAGAFLCGVAFFRAKFDASRSMLFVQL